MSTDHFSLLLLNTAMQPKEEFVVIWLFLEFCGQLFCFERT